MEKEVLNRYPYPIAYNYSLVKNKSSDKRRSLVYIYNFFDSFVRFFSSTLIAQYIKDIIDDEDLNLKLQNLMEPAFRDWIVFMEELLKFYNKSGEKFLVKELFSFYFSDYPSWKNTLKLYNEIKNNNIFSFKGRDIEVISPSDLFHMLTYFMEAIERFKEDLTLNQINDLILLLIPSIEELMEHSKFLFNYELFYVKKVTYEKGKVRHEVIECMGSNFREVEYLFDSYLIQDKVYLRSMVDKNLPMLNLSPLIILSQKKLFYFQKIQGDAGLEYADYFGNKFASQDCTKDMIKAFKKFTGDKKVNLVIKYLDWHKIKTTRRVDKISPVKKDIDDKEERKNIYKSLCEMAWCDGKLAHEEKAYLEELMKTLDLSLSDVKLIEANILSRFAGKIQECSVLSQKQEELEQRLEYLDEENQQLLLNLESKKQYIRKIEKNLRELSTEVGVIKDTDTKSQSDIIEKEKENLKLKNLVKELKSRFDQAKDEIARLEDLKKLEYKVKELEAQELVKDIEFIRLKEQLDKLSGKEHDISSFKKKSSSYEIEIKELNGKLEHARKNIAHLERQLKETAIISENISEFEIYSEEQKQKILELEEHVNELTYEKVRISEELEGERNSSSELKSEIERLNATIISISEELEGERNSSSELKSEIERLNATVSRNSEELGFMIDLKDGFEALEEENEKLLSRNKEYMSQIDLYSGKLKQMEGMKDNVELNIDYLIKEKSDMETAINALKEKLELIEADKEHLKNINDELNEKIAEQEGYINHLSEEKEHLSSALKSKEILEIDREELINDLNMRVAGLEDTILLLTKEKEDLIISRDERLLSIEKEREELISFNNDLNDKLAGLEENIAFLTAEKENLISSGDDRVLYIQQDMEDLKNTNDTLNKKVMELEERIKQLYQDRESILNISHSKISSVEKEMEVLKVDRDNLNKNLIESQNNINRLNSEMAILEKINEEQQKSLEEFRQNSDIMIEQLETVTTSMEIFEAEKEELNLQNIECQSKINVLEAEKMNYQKEKAKMFLLLKDLKNNIGQKQSYIQQIEAKYNEIKKSIDNSVDWIQEKVVLEEKLRKLEKEHGQNIILYEDVKEKNRIIERLENELEELKFILSGNRDEIDPSSPLVEEQGDISDDKTEKNIDQYGVFSAGTFDDTEGDTEKYTEDKEFDAGSFELSEIEEIFSEKQNGEDEVPVSEKNPSVLMDDMDELFPPDDEDEDTLNLKKIKIKNMDNRKKGMFSMVKNMLKADRNAALLPQKASPSKAVISPDLSLDSISNDWPVFMGKLNHDGFNSNETALFPPLEKRWTFTMDSSVKASPAIYRGVIYSGSVDGKLYAIYIRTGEKIWEFDSKGSIVSTPVVIKDWVFFCSDRKIYALDRNSSHVIWSFTSEGPVNSSPSVAYGLLYFGSADGKLYALSVSSGEKIWEYKVRTRADYSPAISDGIICSCSRGDKIFALEAKTGKKIWEKYIGSKFESSPVIYEDRVLLACENCRLYAWNIKTGDSIWKFQSEPTLLSSPAVGNGVAYLASHHSYIYSINTERGEKEWEFVSNSSFVSSPVYANGCLYLGSLDGKFYSLDIATLTPNITELDGQIISSPAIAGGYAVIGTSKGILYAFSSQEIS